VRQVLIDLPDPLPASLAIDAGLRHRLARVLRMQSGTPVLLGDGLGRQVHARFTGHGFDAVAGQPAAPQEPLALTLACAVLKGDRFDWLVEKAAELGVAAIQPLQTEHAVAHAAGTGAATKQQRWQAVATEAFEQCGRPWRTRILTPLPFADWLDNRDLAVPVAVCDERMPPLYLGDWVAGLTPCQAPRPIVVVLGPEGGLADRERSALDCIGATRVWVARSVLRAETAALAAAVIALAPKSGEKQAMR